MVKRGRGRMVAFPDIPDARIAGLMDFVDHLDATPPAGSSPSGPLPSGQRQENPPEVSAAEFSSGGQRYRSGYHHFFSENGLVGPPPWSTLVAYDLNEGKILWQKPYGDVTQLAERGIHGTGSLFPTNSLTATAGGLLFSTTRDRKIRAWDRDTGEVLWSADLPADPGGIPAVYEIDGRQYVVATATRSDTPGDGKSSARHAYVAFTLSGEIR